MEKRFRFATRFVKIFSSFWRTIQQGFLLKRSHHFVFALVKGDRHSTSFYIGSCGPDKQKLE